jgi:hypothetical protein
MKKENIPKNMISTLCINALHDLQSWALAQSFVISASGMSDVHTGKNNGLKWRIAKTFRWRFVHFCRYSVIIIFKRLL